MRLRKSESVEAHIGNGEGEPGVIYDSGKGSKETTMRRKAFMSSFALFAVSVSYGLLLRPARHAASVESVMPPRANVRKGLKSVEEKTCGIWIAPSSLKGHAGFGIYTTRDIKKKESILFGQDGPSIPIVDYFDGPNMNLRENWMDVWGNYGWARGVSDQVNFEANHTVLDYQIGFGSLPNHHCLLDSLDIRYPTPPYDDSMVNRFSSPGAGAFSYSTGRDFFVTKDLKAGDEFFLDYGHCEREGSSDSADWATTIPMVEDYRQAAKVVQKALRKTDKDSKIVVPENANKYVAALLQQASKEELRAAMKSENVRKNRDYVKFVAKYLATTPRTPDWIRSNGMCLEHLVAGKSQLPQAGQGAFSQHKIEKGEMVVPAPLIQIPDKEVLKMYDSDRKQTGTQLLLNYCFGHPESSMLLCPDTNALLINHCSDRKKQCGPKGPNVEYRWSSGWEPSSDEWRKMTIEDIAKQGGRGVSMEIVALRDIEPGEEVYMDYGPEWEEAWKEHEKNWKPPEQDIVPFITAKEANEQETLTLLVTGDLRKVSEHPYLFTGCEFEKQSKVEQLDIWKKPDPSWIELDDKEILKRFSKDGSKFSGNYTSHQDRAHWPCSVIREDESGSYTVRIHRKFGQGAEEWHKNGLPRLLTDFPRDAIHYFVRPYASDQNLPGVFRHPIGLRDEIFPEQWKNRKQP